MLKIIGKLVEIGPRFGNKEAEAAKLITDNLNLLKIPFQKEFFETSVPRVIKAELYADDVAIPCMGSSLNSGEIRSGEYLVNSIDSCIKSLPFNISYSPITDEISVVDFYVEPSVTVSRNSIPQIAMAKNVQGKIVVEKEQFTAENILVGNYKNPKNIVFAHHDSIIGSGALDNAGAIGVIMETIEENQKLLENTLFIFAGNEEISYDDYKTRSGYGFRIFEKNHEDVIRNSKQIIVIDGVGISEPSFVQTGLDWVLQLKLIDEIKTKVFWLQNDQAEVLKYFHTKADTLDKLEKIYLEAAKALLLRKLS